MKDTTFKEDTMADCSRLMPDIRRHSEYMLCTNTLKIDQMALAIISRVICNFREMICMLRDLRESHSLHKSQEI